MFDLFASRYGYSIEQFYSLTLRQIYSIKKVIEKSNRIELRQKAALHGKELKGDAPEVIEYDAEQENDNEAEAKKMLARMRAKHKDSANGYRQRTTD